jgi:hypothetical protein
VPPAPEADRDALAQRRAGAAAKQQRAVAVELAAQLAQPALRRQHRDAAG